MISQILWIVLCVGVSFQVFSLTYIHVWIVVVLSWNCLKMLLCQSQISLVHTMIPARTSLTLSSALRSWRKWGRGHSERSIRFVAMTMDNCMLWRSLDKGSEVSGIDARSSLRLRNMSDCHHIRTASSFTKPGKRESSFTFRLNCARWGTVCVCVCVYQGFIEDF